MGKYTEGYARVAKDRYITPRTAVVALAKFIDLRGLRFIEPCAANGSFVAHMASEGAHCVHHSGLEPEAEGIAQMDALDQDWFEIVRHSEADAIITNPPWSRAFLHPMIQRFSDAAPTLLLFDANWINTKQARPYQDRLVAVFQAGRHRWFEGTDDDKGQSPKDDTSWYLFHRPVPGRLPRFLTKPFDEGPVSLEQLFADLKRA